MFGEQESQNRLKSESDVVTLQIMKNKKVSSVMAKNTSLRFFLTDFNVQTWIPF